MSSGALDLEQLRPPTERLESLLTSGPVDWFRVKDDAEALASLILPEQRDELRSDLVDNFVSSRWLAARTLTGEALIQLGEPERAAAVDPRKRAAELVSRPGLTAEAAAEVLADLYDATVFHDAYYGEDRPRNNVVRELGEKLNEQGGIALMRQAHDRFSTLRPPVRSPVPGSMLERIWHEIGDWRM